jgi:hypothetical protein
MTQLSLLSKHRTGLPALIKVGLHPIHSCQACNSGNIRRAPMGANSDTDPLLPVTRFHLDFGFIRASSADFGVSAGNHIVTSFDGNNTYLLIVCAKSRHTWIFCQASKSPPIFIIERFLAMHGLKTGSRFLHMDKVGDLWRSQQLCAITVTVGYTMEPTGSDAASENGKVERPNGIFIVMVRYLLCSAGLLEIFWSAALVHAVYLKNRLYHNAFHQTPHEAWTGGKPPLDHLCTFGALMTAHKPGKRPTKADRHTAHGVLMGYGATTKHVPYFDQMMNREKLSAHHTIDEAHYSKTYRPPGPQILIDMGYDQRPELPVITTQPSLSQYQLRSRHKTVTPFLCKLLSLEMNEFASSPFTIIASIATSDIDRNNSVTITFSTDTFGPSFPETILVSGIRPTLSFDMHYDIDQHRCQLIRMSPVTPSHRLFQWKSHLRSVHILSINTMSVHTVADMRLVISEACLAKRTSIVISFTKDDAPNYLSVVGLLQLYFDQHRIMHGHIENTILKVVHKSVTGPKFNHHTLQKQLDRKDWLTAEWIQMENYAKKNICGAPCTAPIDASIFFWAWLYSIKPREIDRKKVRGICDGSTCRDKTMVHAMKYAPTPQHIDDPLQVDMSALMGMYLWQPDVTNVFAEADHPEQIYCIHCNQVFKDWRKTRHPAIKLPPPMRFFLCSRTSKAILKAFASGPSVAMRSLSRSSARTLHMPRVCTTAFSVMSLLDSFVWLTISQLHANLRKLIPSYVTCWKRTGKYPCRDMA